MLVGAALHILAIALGVAVAAWLVTGWVLLARYVYRKRQRGHERG